MKKSESKRCEESLEEEVRRLRRENKSLKASKEATKAKLTVARAELKKKTSRRKPWQKSRKN